jgi:hypothetical protein
MYYIGKNANLVHLIKEGEKSQTTCGYTIRKLDLLLLKAGKPQSRIVPARPDNLPVCKQCSRFSD